MVEYSDLSDDAEHRTLEQFVELCNIIEPDHYYIDKPDPFYPDTATLCPLSCDDVQYKWSNQMHRTIAFCGPQDGIHRYKATLKVNAKLWTTYSQSKQLVVLLHEMTHLRYFGADDDVGGTHSKEFWRRFAFYCMTALDRWAEVTDLFPDATVDEFRCEAVDDVHAGLLDKRQLTVDEARSMIRDYLFGYRPGTRFVRVETNQPLAADK